MALDERQKEEVHRIVNTDFLAELLGITPRQVRNLAAENIIRPRQKNPYRFMLCQAVQDFIAYKAKGSPEDGSIEDDARQKKANADIAVDKAKKYRMIVSTLEGKMHEAQDVKKFTAELTLAFRQAAIALPNTLAYPTARTNDPAITESIIREEVNKMLDSLSEYDYEKAAYIKATRDRAAIAMEEPVEELDDE